MFKAQGCTQPNECYPGNKLYYYFVLLVGTKFSTFIRGGLAHPRRVYTFDHGWARTELRASLTAHTSQKSKVYLRPAPPLTVVAPSWRCRSARRCSPSPGGPPPCLPSPDCSRERRPGAVSRNAETTVPSSGRGWCRGSPGSTAARRRRIAAYFSDRIATCKLCYDTCCATICIVQY
jgi:hypothetical protein